MFVPYGFQQTFAKCPFAPQFEQFVFLAGHGLLECGREKPQLKHVFSDCTSLIGKPWKVSSIPEA